MKMDLLEEVCHGPLLNARWYFQTWPCLSLLVDNFVNVWSL